MYSLQIIVLIMSFAIALVGLALKLRVTYPLALVIGGALLGFIPGLGVNFDPNLILVIVLPPILYYAAFSISPKQFRRHIQVILGLALGLIAVTTLVIGVLFKYLLPDLPWPLAFAFGALISPPDAVAATTILKRFSISSRLITILEGESLINDATGLVLFKMAIVALLSGTFSLFDSSFEFLKVVSGGVLVGIITGIVLHGFSSHFFHPILAVVFSFVIPYATYILADMLHVSGVLAVVVNGLISSRMLKTYFASLTRVLGWAFWDVLIILITCFVFTLIGLQLNGIIRRLSNETVLLYIGYGFIITAATILIRFFWVYLREFFAHIGNKRESKEHTHLTFQERLIVSWSSMRGIVSMTMALSLPFYSSGEISLPGRDAVIFLTFVVIFLTLLIPGLTLPLLLRWLNIQSTRDYVESHFARGELLKAAQEEIQSLNDIKQINEEEAKFLFSYFKARHKIFEITLKSKTGSNTLEVARLRVLRRKRERLFEMWEQNDIDDLLYNLLERELDLAEAYLVRGEI